MIFFNGLNILLKVLQVTPAVNRSESKRKGFYSLHVLMQKARTLLNRYKSTKQMNVVRVNDVRLGRIKTMIEDKPFIALLNSGASCNFINKDKFLHLNLPYVEKKMKFGVANNTSYTSGVADIELKIGLE